MVVSYPTASEGSCLSFFVVTPQIICHWRGSIIPKVFPQVAMSVGLAALARWWNPLSGRHEDVQSGMATLGILLSFLVVFKTNTAYGQFWEACTQTQKMLQMSRFIAMQACMLLPFDDPVGASARAGEQSPRAEDTQVDVWSGGVLRVRVIGAYKLLNKAQGAGSLQAPYAVVRVGSCCFKTDVGGNQLNPVWNSEIFELTLHEGDTAITFVVRDSKNLATDNLGWMHLQSSDLLQVVDSKWQRMRYRLQDGGCGELELDVYFSRCLPSKPLDATQSCGKLLAPLTTACGPASPKLFSQPLLGTGYSHAIAPPKHAADFGEEGKVRLGPCADDQDLSVNAFLRRIVRLLALHFFVVVEYFRRTGQNAIIDPDDQDNMRLHIQALTGEREYAMLYPGDDREVVGSRARNVCAKPTLVLYWLMLTIGRCASIHKIPPPVLSSFVPQIARLADHFHDMDKIDKTQFPLPYTQVLKILTIIFIFLLPWVLQPRCGDLTELVVGLCAVGFFGLDEVAEILESPFGNDPNDIDLCSYGQDLLDDLELMYYGREKQLDTVSRAHSRGDLFEQVDRRASVSSQKQLGAFTVYGKTQQL